MEFLPKKNKITAIQIKPENYQLIVDTFEGYTIQNGALISQEGTKRQDTMWIVSFESETGKTDKCISDSLFKIMFNEKPVEHYTLGELVSMNRRARKDDYPMGDYLEWNGFTWVLWMCGIQQVYSPTPEEITEKCWLPV